MMVWCGVQAMREKHIHIHTYDSQRFLIIGVEVTELL